MRARYGRPRLLGTAARTAVVAGTATAVSGRVAARQQARSQPAPAPEPQPAPQAPQAPAEDPIARLRELAELHEQGALTDDEFATMKAKVLAG